MNNRTWALLLVALLCVGCKEKPKATKTPPAPRVKVAQDWLASTWIEQIVVQTTAIPKYLGADEGRRSDLFALWGNRWYEVAKKKLDLSLKPDHRAVRARVHLRLAEFYKAAYRLGSGMNLGRLQARYSRKGKLNLGKLFYYYYGRQLCMSGFKAKAVKMLQQALKELPEKRKARAALWLQVCQPDAAKKLPELLKNAKFKGDEGGSAEQLLIRKMHQIKGPSLEGSSDRAELYTRILVHKKPPRKSKYLRGLAEAETIKEGKISGELEFFDPGILWALFHTHAQLALAYLSKAPATDGFAPFYRGLAHKMLGQHKEAKAQLEAFVKKPPAKINWAYLLYSPRWSIAAMKTEAQIELAALSAQKDPKGALAKLEKIAAQKQPPAAYANLAILRLAKGDKALQKKAFGRLEKSVALGRELTKQLFLRYTKAGESKKSPSAQAAAAILREGMHTYAARPLFIWASKGALLVQDTSKAVRWLEQLHRKGNAYAIGGRNEATHFVLAASAYIRAGKMPVATLYFSKAKDPYPAVTQLWSLLRILRTYRKTEGGDIIIDPKSG